MTIITERNNHENDTVTCDCLRCGSTLEAARTEGEIRDGAWHIKCPVCGRMAKFLDSGFMPKSAAVP